MTGNQASRRLADCELLSILGQFPAYFKLLFAPADRVWREVFGSGEGIEERLSLGDDSKSYLVRLMPYRDRDDGVTGVVITLVDITSLARAEQLQKVLISELNHRVKNMLAVVISITKNTLNTSIAPEDFARRLTGRLHGMARAYSLLSQAEWTKVSIRHLVQAEADAVGAERIEAHGAEVELAPEQALSLGMVIHELTTNALKYGALSVDEGRVEVAWQVIDGRLELTWRERDGPEVVEPQRKGFGLVLIEGQICYQNEGHMEARFESGGLVLTLAFQLKRQPSARQ